jgi:hypothetical protein
MIPAQLHPPPSPTASASPAAPAPAPTLRPGAPLPFLVCARMRVAAASTSAPFELSSRRRSASFFARSPSALTRSLLPAASASHGAASPAWAASPGALLGASRAHADGGVSAASSPTAAAVTPVLNPAAVAVAVAAGAVVAGSVLEPAGMAEALAAALGKASPTAGQRPPKKHSPMHLQSASTTATAVRPHGGGVAAVAPVLPSAAVPAAVAASPRAEGEATPSARAPAPQLQLQVSTATASVAPEGRRGKPALAAAGIASDGQLSSDSSGFGSGSVAVNPITGAPSQLLSAQASPPSPCGFLVGAVLTEARGVKVRPCATARVYFVSAAVRLLKCEVCVVCVCAGVYYP